MNNIQTADKVLYLDFDGVLHDDAVYWSPKRGIYIKTPGRTLFEWMPILDELLEPNADVKIILSTSWVRVKSFEFAKKHLSGTLQARVIGATYHRREMRGKGFELLPRGVQVWGDVVLRKPKSWFAIDNDDDAWTVWCRDKLVKTDDRFGLSDPAVQQAVRAMLEQL
ncbi:HAD domain-containing protein [Noviherbaspirillum sp. UKPF54]|uniref:HAD domain-containing protein n=1 Tax=Noviherbaspirillum sp. UKPF54 TaxID=2601898 RepID=UPI0011B137D7|nr:HAD domain-containing protein [Noviherbaspirillum sp. UKPF54]QDZ28707.1 hypothetical protein FAY22_12545 [Noviherbaspirillum sp. UKPF54]